jgi:thiol-disulfide isomerase/thioredoxin
MQGLPIGPYSNGWADRGKMMAVKAGNRIYTAAAAFLLAAFVQASSAPLYPLGPDISPEELASFSATIYTEKEQLPLGGLVTLEGIPYDSSALSGKYVLVNLGASWCPYCGREKPTLQRLYLDHADERFAVLAVFVGEQAATAKRYMEENGYGFPAAADPEDAVGAQYAARVPTSYVIDPEGNIIARIDGSKEWDSDLALRMLGYATGIELPGEALE